MQSLYGAPVVPRMTTRRAVRIMERVLSANGVSRVRDLPEEARVRLYCQLATFFEEERAAQWERQVNGSALQRAGRWLQEALEGLRQALQA